MQVLLIAIRIDNGKNHTKDKNNKKSIVLQNSFYIPVQVKNN